jgi:hypothetical protein
MKSARTPNRPNILLRLLGPGLVTGAADDDPSGIPTLFQAGAQFGYGLLWTVFLDDAIHDRRDGEALSIRHHLGSDSIANIAHS